MADGKPGRPKKYTDEFKANAVDYVLSTGKTYAEAGADLGVPKRTIGKWVRARRLSEPERAAADEAKRLRRENERLREENEFLKKSRDLLRRQPAVADLYRLMAAEKGRFGVGTMARVLGVSRSGFYAWLGREGGGAPQDPWAADRDAVERAWLDSGRRMGARSIRSLMPRLTPCRVRKIMRELGIQGARPRASRRTTVPDPGAAERPDLVRRDFGSPVPTTRLVGDITYLRTGQGWLYMATVIDLCTRMVVGLAFSERMTAELPIAALEAAACRGYVAGGAVFHSDRGSQYTSRAMAEWASAHDVRLSVGRTGSCHDNAVAESFFGTFKNEMYHLRSFATREEARLASIEYVEGYYNRRRPHSTIGYQVPAEKMDAFFERFEAAVGSEGVGPVAA